MGRRLSLCAALLVLTAIAFRPVFGAEFVAWDDDKNFLANPAYRGTSLEHLKWMFTTFHMGPYQPLAWLTLAIDHALFGMDPRGYHVTNVVWHAATVVLFFFLARAVFASARQEWSERTRDLFAVLAAALFGVHPLRAESVAWITERRDVVSGAFFVATVLAWVAYARSNDGRARRYALALGLFVLALLSKASVVTLPLALLALDIWPLGRWNRERRRVLLEKLPFLALSILFGAVAVLGQRSTGTALRALGDHGLDRRIAQAAYAAWFHTEKSIWPADLSPIYDMPSPFDSTELRFVLAITFVVVTSVVLWLARRRVPAVTAAWCAFLVLLAPVSGLVSTGPQLVADRYSYLACMPYALLAAGAAGWLAERAAWRLPALGLALAACAVLTASTARQASYWRTSSDLWERAYEIAPDSAVACDHLGVERVNASSRPGLDVATRQRLLEEAVTLYTHAYEVNPHPNHVFNIGGAIAAIAELVPAERTKEYELAAQTMKQGLEFAEQTSGVQPNWRVMYASALVELKRYEEASEQLALALQVVPDHVNALRWSARIALEQGRPDEGLALLRRTVEIDPENTQSWSILASKLRQLGHVAEAEAAEARARATKNPAGMR